MPVANRADHSSARRRASPLIRTASQQSPLCSNFFEKSRSPAPLLLLCTKSHAWLACSVVNALLRLAVASNFLCVYFSAGCFVFLSTDERDWAKNTYFAFLSDFVHFLLKTSPKRLTSLATYATLKASK